jgi:16S rRNA processing protein RimM
MFVEMGEIVRAVGLRGEIKLLISGDFDEAVMASEFLQLREQGGTLSRAKILRSRWKGETLVVGIEGISDRNAAEAAVGGLLGFSEADYDHAEFPRPEGHLPFVYSDLSVVDVSGEQLGSVEEVLCLPANRVLRVRRPDGSEVLIPVIAPVVRELDLEGKRLVIEPLPGMLDDDADAAK